MIGKKGDADDRNILLVLNAYVMSNLPFNSPVTTMLSSNLDDPKALNSIEDIIAEL